MKIEDKRIDRSTNIAEQKIKIDWTSTLSTSSSILATDANLIRKTSHESAISKAKNRRIGAGLKPLYPDVEELNKWIEILRQDGIAITTYKVQQKIKSLLNNEYSQQYPNAKNSFIASYKWFYGFMNHYDLSIHQKNKNWTKIT
ncbi:3465_t:CDS:2 [Ambispora leptoticha]|uniref:3465_t:CDS:1 n=1 Tax=Ambispora leptoticha TaxID=144679 RepID=A0A9N9CAP0_9GLOM|nr:3465_t:CDS:2 [Ambispora leptoticha]